MPFEPLRAAYSRQLAERALSHDEAQIAAVEHLEELRMRLIAAREQDAAVVRRLLAAVGLGRARKSVRGLYLWGGVGRGKTWLMDLFFQSLPFQQRRRRHFHRFMQEVHAELKTLQGSAAPLEVIGERIAAQVRVLCFDELYVSDVADAMLLGGLFSAMLRRGVTLVATSNIPPQELYRHGLQRERFMPTIELLQQSLEVLHLEGATDYRLRQLTNAGTYLPANAAGTRLGLQSLFRELAGGSTLLESRSEPNAPRASDPGQLEIEGRRIPVVRESSGVVWFEFAAICGGPRSQDDYIEIARRYHTAIVSDVPRFDSASEDAARRFVALVDELYDHRVKLIVSAAAAPAALYQGERIAGLFERAASRLVEMQSREYLASEHRP